MSEPDYRAMWEELKEKVGMWQHAASQTCTPYNEWAPGRESAFDQILDEMEEALKQAHDPTRTPAVRRATHWVVDDCTFATPEAAYRYLGSKAAWSALRKIGRRGKYWPCLPIGTSDKIGRLIRLREEKAGYR